MRASLLKFFSIISAVSQLFIVRRLPFGILLSRPAVL